MKHNHRLAMLASTAVLVATPLQAAPAAAPPPAERAAPQAEDEPGPDEIERLTAWPEVPKADAKALSTNVQRLRKANTEEMGVQAKAELIQMGAACAPELLAKLGKEKDEEARARMVAVLEAVTTAAHTRLLAAEFDAKEQHVRTWCLGRVAAFPDAGTRAEAEAALARAGKVKEPEKADREERLMAALAATAAGSLAGIEHLADRAEKVWGTHGAAMRVALEAVRGPAATALVVPRLEGERTQRIAALHLLAGCGDKDAIPHVRPLLDDNDNSIRIGAINALRGIVDGDPPLDKLPVFKAIEVAQAWKGRV